MAIYELYSFDDIWDAIDAITKQYETGDLPLTWHGPDKLHYEISATSPPPSWHFSEAGLQYHEEHGRNFYAIRELVIFQLGFHQGVVSRDLKSPEATARRLRDTFEGIEVMDADRFVQLLTPKAS